MRAASDVNEALQSLASELTGITADGHFLGDDGAPLAHPPAEEQSMQYRRALRDRAAKRERVVGWLGLLLASPPPSP